MKICLFNHGVRQIIEWRLLWPDRSSNLHTGREGQIDLGRILIIVQVIWWTTFGVYLSVLLDSEYLIFGTAWISWDKFIIILDKPNNHCKAWIHQSCNTFIDTQLLKYRPMKEAFYTRFGKKIALQIQLIAANFSIRQPPSLHHLSRFHWGWFEAKASSTDVQHFYKQFSP